jgi:two-component system sensor histidine kinase UhpB
VTARKAGATAPQESRPPAEPAGRWPAARRAALGVLLVCAGYYLTGLASLIARFPSSGISTIWTPTAVLLAALLLVPVRTWWVYVLALWPIHLHLVVNFQGAVPLVVMLCQFGGNVAHAVLAAVLVRWVVGVPVRFDDLRSMAAFIVLVGIAVPWVVSAVVVYLFELTDWVEDYWLALWGRALSNGVGALTVTPLVLGAVAGGSAALRGVPARRYAEFGLLVAGLLAVGIAVFGAAPAGPESSPALLYAPLPLLGWAAVRFGPGGLCFALLVVAFLSLSGAMAGRGPFSSPSPVENTLALQLFLLTSVIPLLLLAALLGEQERTASALRTSNEQIQDLAGRLITSQEVERTRIARELHDDVSQRLSALAITLSGLKQWLPEGPGHDEWARLRRRTAELVESVRNLSHELHPGILRHAGLAAALEAYCAEFATRHALAVSFHPAGGFERIPPDVALCLYRVTQEALWNVARHAGARGARVGLARTAGGVELTVADDGQGFDPAAARRGGGLGLISLDERVRLVRGTVELDTQPGRGTQLRVRVPWQGAADSGSLPGL